MEHLVLAGFTNKQSIIELIKVTIKILASCVLVGQSILLRQLVQQTISTHGKIFYEIQARHRIFLNAHYSEYYSLHLPEQNVYLSQSLNNGCIIIDSVGLRLTEFFILDKDRME